MSAAERAGLARKARAVLGPEAEPGLTRAASLGRLAAGVPAAATQLTDLTRVPDWLPADAGARERFVARAGLAAAAPKLAKVIDGTVLRAFAERAGPDALDWALGVGSRADAPAIDVPLDPARLDGIGSVAVRSSLPDAFGAYFPGEATLSPIESRWIVQRAGEAA